MYLDSDIPLVLDMLLMVYGVSSSHWEQELQRHATASCKIILPQTCIFPSLKWSCLDLFSSLQWGTVPRRCAEQNVSCSHARHVLPSGTSVSGSRARQILFPQKRHVPAIPAKGPLIPLQGTTSSSSCGFFSFSFTSTLAGWLYCPCSLHALL